jgi:PBSX family phage terminase large subunit
VNSIEINPNLFNPLYWHIEDALNNGNIRHIYLYGGSSAAKTYSVAQNLFLNGEKNNYSSIVFRKEQASINDTIYNDFKEINDFFELDHKMQQFLIKMYESDNVIRFRGVDKSGKVKGLKGYKKILLDELDHFDYEDYKELKRRLRGEDNQQVLYTWNPVSKEHWVKTKVLDTEKWIETSKEIDNCPSEYSKLSDKSGKWINDRGDSILIKTNHLDNYWICGHPEEGFGRYDKHAMSEFNIMKRLDPDDYAVYAWGDWGNPRVDMPYITQFEDDKHISEKAVFNQKDQFIMSFDFNVDNCAVIFAHVGNDYIYIFDEMVGSDLPDLLSKIKFKYGKYLINCLVTGDSAGNARNHMVSDSMNSYRLIKNTLGITSRQVKVMQNPKHKDSRITCNTIFAFHSNLYINPKCELTIYDLKNVEANQEGGIIKKDRSVANQKGDFLDAVRYLFGNFKKKFIRDYNK